MNFEIPRIDFEKMTAVAGAVKTHKERVRLGLIRLITDELAPQLQGVEAVRRAHSLRDLGQSANKLGFIPAYDGFEIWDQVVVTPSGICRLEILSAMTEKQLRGLIGRLIHYLGEVNLWILNAANSPGVYVQGLTAERSPATASDACDICGATIPPQDGLCYECSGEAAADRAREIAEALAEPPTMQGVQLHLRRGLEVLESLTAKAEDGRIYQIASAYEQFTGMVAGWAERLANPSPPCKQCGGDTTFDARGEFCGPGCESFYQRAQTEFAEPAVGTGPDDHICTVVDDCPACKAEVQAAWAANPDHICDAAVGPESGVSPDRCPACQQEAHEQDGPDEDEHTCMADTPAERRTSLLDCLGCQYEDRQGTLAGPPAKDSCPECGAYLDHLETPGKFNGYCSSGCQQAVELPPF